MYESRMDPQMDSRSYSAIQRNTLEQKISGLSANVPMEPNARMILQSAISNARRCIEVQGETLNRIEGPVPMDAGEAKALNQHEPESLLELAQCIADLVFTAGSRADRIMSKL